MTVTGKQAEASTAPRPPRGRWVIIVALGAATVVAVLLVAVLVSVSRAESSPAGLARLLASSGGARLGYPVVADTSGRLADGYGVQDLPWTEVISASGQIRYHHDGWLPASTLARVAG